MILRLLFQMSEEEEFPFVWFMIYFPLVVAMFFLNFFADTPTECDVSQSVFFFVQIYLSETETDFFIESNARRIRIICVPTDLSLV